MPPENYLEEPPDDLDYTKNEWLELSYHQQYYRVEDERRKYIKQKARENKQRNRDWIRSVKEVESCRQCGEDRWQTLDFHHTGEKKDAVSRLASQEYGIETIAKEIEKCVILCANCHRVHHDGSIDLDNLETGSEKSRAVLDRNV